MTRVEGNGSSSYVQANLGTWFGANNTLIALRLDLRQRQHQRPDGRDQPAPSGGWNMPFLSVDGLDGLRLAVGRPGTDYTTAPCRRR